ncbi:MAG TPA: ankyrin repeat domain-containing protein [Phycisphaerales bacterium]|nr:ankyrin repeat domain-containing protein [Phycisphaerales bacterium]
MSPKLATTGRRLQILAPILLLPLLASQQNTFLDDNFRVNPVVLWVLLCGVFFCLGGMLGRNPRPKRYVIGGIVLLILLLGSSLSYNRQILRERLAVAVSQPETRNEALRLLQEHEFLRYERILSPDQSADHSGSRTSSSSGLYACAHACKRGDLEMLQLILSERPAHLKEIDYNSDGPLYWSVRAEKNSREVVEFLLNHNAWAEEPVALFTVVAEDRDDLLRLFLANGAHWNSLANIGPGRSQILIEAAKKYGASNCLKLLLEQKASTDNSRD